MAEKPLIENPKRNNKKELSTQEDFDKFTPNIIVRLFGFEKKIRSNLEEKIRIAIESDDEDHKKDLSMANEKNSDIILAKRLIDLHPNAVDFVLENHSQIGNLPFSVEEMRTIFVDERVIAVIDGLDFDDMPDSIINLLKSGNISTKPISAGKRNEIHRTAICSAAVRVATECLANLPIDEIEVVMMTDIHDPSSGHILPAPVLYMRVTLQALEAVNLMHVDAVAFVDRLHGEMDWNKKHGFRPINLDALEIDIAAVDFG